MVKSKDIDLEYLYRNEGDPRARIRLLGLVHFYLKGKNKKEVSEIVLVNEHTVASWIKKYEEFGLEGIYDEQRSGRKPNLTVSEEDKFKSELETLEAEKNGDRLIGEDIQGLLKNKFNVDYTVNGVYALMHRLGYSWITARSKHPKSDPEIQEIFKK